MRMIVTAAGRACRPRFAPRRLASAALVLLTGAPLALAQSVTGSGNVAPGLPPPGASNWNPGGTITVGDTSTGTLTIAAGGTVSSGFGILGNSSGGDGMVTVTGAGSLWSNSLQLNLGVAGSGTLTVSAGGKVSAPVTNLAASSSGSGTLTLLGDAANGRGVLETGRVIKGTGTATLVLNGGILQARQSGSDYLQGFSTLTIGANGAFFDSVGYAIGVATSFDGTGGLTKLGAGSLALSGNNSYSGATLVEAGRLIASASTALSPNSNHMIAAGATLELTDIPGLIVTAGSVAGAGKIELGSGTRLKAGASNASTNFSGSISGGGALEKTGSGVLTLSGTNSYIGGTTVSGGKLVVNGAIVGAVTLNGGALGGSGTVGSVAVGSGGTIAPGNSIGTLAIHGAVSFGAGSTYQVEVNAAGQSDRIVAAGLATLSGGTVAVLAEAGNYAAATRYTILTATGGVSGQFAGVTSNLAFLTPSLSYDASDVTLTMTRNSTGFGPDGGPDGGAGAGGSGPAGSFVAQTRNQGFIASAAERLGAGNPVYDTLLSATAAEARTGFDLLSGEAHAQAVSVMIGESALVREAVLGRLRGPLLTPPGGQVAAGFSADQPGRQRATLMPAPRLEPRYAFWGEAFGGQGNSSTDGNAASLSWRSGGAILGADMLLSETSSGTPRVGVAVGYSQSRFDLDARLSSGRIESGHAALYAGGRFGAVRLDAGLAYSWSESDIRRQVAIRGFGDLLRSQRPGALAQAFAEFGYGFAWQGLALEPFAQLALLRVSSDAGIEQGGAAALGLRASEQLLGFSTLGLRAEAQLGATPLFARAMLGWRHGFGELTPQALTAFAAGTTPSRVFAAAIDRNALALGAGLDWRANVATTLGLSYAATLGERSNDHALKGRIDVRF